MTLSVDMAKAAMLRDELRRVESRVLREQARRPLTVADERAMTDMRVRADAVLHELGRYAPPPLPGEYPDEFRVRLLKGIKPHSKTWRDIPDDALHDFRADDGGLDNVERVIFEEARADALCPSDLGPREIRAIEAKGPGGHSETKFVGGEDAWFGHQFSRRPRLASLRSRDDYMRMSYKGW